MSVGQIQLLAATASAPVGWRVLSGNNRVAGRGIQVYPDAESCRIAVKELQRDITLLERRIRRAEPNRWVWELRRDRVPVVLAGHAFDRLIRCEQAAAQFLALLAEASVGASVVVTGARRWGSVATGIAPGEERIA